MICGGVFVPLALAEVHLRAGALLPFIAAATVAVVVGALLLYARERALTRGRRVLLGALRTVLIAALLALLLEPVAVLARTVVVPSNLLVLLDVSKSMATADPRTRPDDVRDAALAFGRVRFREPELQALLARAARAMDEGRAALAGGSTDAAALVAAAREALGAADRRARARAADTSSPAAGPAAEAVPRTDAALAGEIARALAALVARQDAIAATGDEKERAPAAAAQGTLRDEVDALRASLRDAVGTADDGASPARRIDLARAILDHPDLGFLRNPGAHVVVRRFRFGETLAPAEGEGDAAPESLRTAEPTDAATCLGSALEEAVSRFTGQGIDGVVVLTDGASNLGLDALEAARRLRERAVPIYPVGIGLPAPDDVAVRGVLVGDAALAGERVPFVAELGASGFGGRAVEVVATLDGAEVARRTVVIDGARTLVPMEFTAPAKHGGVRLEVSAAALAGEVSSENNRAAREIELIDEKIKVLYVEGRPRWEYRYLRAVLLRDPRLDVRFLLTEGDADLPRTSPQHLVRFPEQTSDAARYDLVILGNVPARFFTPAQLAWLADLVRKHGGSFLLLAGEQAPATYVGTPVAEILPIAFSDGALEAVEPSVFPALTEAGVRSGVMALDDAGRSEAFWSLVRPLHRLPHLAGAKPGAFVLATLSGNRPGDPYPLIVWQRAGTGKALFVATDALWRLRLGRGDALHARFWGQTIRFLTLSRLLGENRRVRIEPSARAPRAGERVEVRATVLDETFEPARLPEFTLEVMAEHMAGAQALRLDPVPGSPGLFSGAFTPDREGVFTLGPVGESRELGKPAKVVATAAGREAIEPDLKRDVLARMAELSGGAYVEIRDLPALAAILPEKPAVRTFGEERELWDRWIVLAVVLVAAGVEWLVRRRHDLP